MRALAREVDHLLSRKIKVRIGRYLVEFMYRQLKDLFVCRNTAKRRKTKANESL